VLHRYPVVTPDKEPWEKEFIDLQERIGVAQREVSYVTTKLYYLRLEHASSFVNIFLTLLPSTISQHYMSLVGGTPAQMICDTDPVSNFRTTKCFAEPFY
jgi:39S mitochondrial ribosomal protein L46